MASDIAGQARLGAVTALDLSPAHAAFVFGLNHQVCERKAFICTAGMHSNLAQRLAIMVR